uniref:SH3 domain-containing protein n=1 Tax=Waltera acetigignens TaxID=2981769 RepID=UPI003F7F5D0A
MKKYKNRKDAVKTVVAILCAALMLTACGSKETTSNETASTETTSAETTSVESTEITTTEETVAEPTVEPTEAPMESKTAPAESPAPAVEPTAAPVESTAVSTGYTYSELSQTMYAKSAVNVRDLPSTDGKKIGSLKASQEITVTGKCDQTGWYRFDWNNTTGYVSDRYIVSEKPAVNTVVVNTGSNSTAGNTTQQNTAAPAATPTPAQTPTTGTTDTSGEYFDRAMAEQVFALVNEERVANGIPALIWSEDVYNIAVQRCYENDLHAGVRAGTSENYSEGQQTAEEIYQGWHDSPGHHDNYMNPNYTYSAVAVRVVPLMGGALGNIHVHYQVFTWDSTVTNSSVTINTPVQDDSVAAATKTADEDTGASSSNVGWSLTPPTQEDGLKKWQEQNPDAEVSFGN